MGAPVNEETVGHLRQRLNVMRDIVKVKIQDHENDNDMSFRRRKLLQLKA